MFEKFRQRSRELEHLDKGDYTAEEYEGCIVELQRVNRWLGDVSALKSSLLRDIQDAGLKRFSVVDVGAGSGELLHVIAEWSEKTRRQATLVGIELNERSAREIRARRKIVPLNATLADGFKLPFADDGFDYALCSLFTHHFKDDDAVRILMELARVSRRGVVVIDLHRHPVAYLFFTTIARLFLHNRLIREDGALSILRSFKPQELADLARRAQLQSIKVSRHFPYRLVLRAAKTPATANVEAEPQNLRMAS